MNKFLIDRKLSSNGAVRWIYFLTSVLACSSGRACRRDGEGLEGEVDKDSSSRLDR